MVAVGQTVQLSVSVRDINGVPLSTPVRWSSLAPAVAVVDSLSGSVRGVSPGSVTIRARSGGVDGSLAMTVQ
jgi:uncharacterized protein YjdB